MIYSKVSDATPRARNDNKVREATERVKEDRRNDQRLRAAAKRNPAQNAEAYFLSQPGCSMWF